MYGVDLTSRVAPRQTKNTARSGVRPVKNAPVKEPKNFPASGARVWMTAPMPRGTSIIPPGTFSRAFLMGIDIDFSCE